MSKRAGQLCWVGIVLAPIFSLVIWSTWVVHAFNLPNPYWHNLVRAAQVAFAAPNLRWVVWASLAGRLQ